MSTITTVSDHVKSGILATIFVGVATIRNAIKTLSGVAGPSVLESPRSRTFLQTIEGDTWIGVSSGPVVMRVELSGVNGDDHSGSHCIPFAKLKRIAELVDCNMMGIDLSEDGLTIGVSALYQKGGINATFKLCTEQAGKVGIPDLSPTDPGMSWHCEADDVLHAVERCKASIGNGSRVASNGVFVQCGEDGLTFLSTDHAKLTRSFVVASQGYFPDKPRMIPDTAIKALVATAKFSKGERLAVEFQSGRVNGLDAHYLRIRSSRVDLRITLDAWASLPSFSEEQVFPAERQATIEVADIKALGKAVKLATDSDDSVILKSNGESLSVCSGEDACLDVPIVAFDGKPFNRTVNGKELAKYLKTIGKASSVRIDVCPELDDRIGSDGKAYSNSLPINFTTGFGDSYAIQPIGIERPKDATTPSPDFPDPIVIVGDCLDEDGKPLTISIPSVAIAPPADPQPADDESPIEPVAIDPTLCQGASDASEPAPVAIFGPNPSSMEKTIIDAIQRKADAIVWHLFHDWTLGQAVKHEKASSTLGPKAWAEVMRIVERDGPKRAFQQTPTPPISGGSPEASTLEAPTPPVVFSDTDDDDSDDADDDRLPEPTEPEALIRRWKGMIEDCVWVGRSLAQTEDFPFVVACMGAWDCMDERQRESVGRLLDALNQPQYDLMRRISTRARLEKFVELCSTGSEVSFRIPPMPDPDRERMERVAEATLAPTGGGGFPETSRKAAGVPVGETSGYRTCDLPTACHEATESTTEHQYPIPTFSEVQSWESLPASDSPHSPSRASTSASEYRSVSGTTPATPCSGRSSATTCNNHSSPLSASTTGGTSLRASASTAHKSETCDPTTEPTEAAGRKPGAFFKTTIGAETYGVTIGPDWVDFCRKSGDCHRVYIEAGGSLSCDCPSARFRPGPCKHQVKARELGLVPEPAAQESPSGFPEPDNDATELDIKATPDPVVPDVAEEPDVEETFDPFGADEGECIFSDMEDAMNDERATMEAMGIMPVSGGAPEPERYDVEDLQGYREEQPTTEAPKMEKAKPRKKKTPWRSSTDRAQRIIDAAKELHEACYDAWAKDDDVAFRAAWVVMSDMLRITMKEGEEVEDWSGGTIAQSDTILATLDVLKTYKADEKAS